MMRPSQRSVTESAELAHLDRRTVLKLCAASLSAAALGGGMSGCAAGSYRGGEVIFIEMNRAKLRAAVGEIARTMLSLLEQETSNEAAVKRMDRVLKEADIWYSALVGPVAPVDQIGHSLILSGGERGFMTLKVYNDSKFVLPLIVRRGVPAERALAATRAASCCMTAGTCTYNTVGEWAAADSQADDPCLGAGYVDAQELSRQRRDLFSLQEVVAYADVIRKCVEVLETEGEVDMTVLQAWLTAQQTRFALDKIFLSARRDGDVLWVDWMLLFHNGAVGMAQVAKGKVQPVYSTVKVDTRAGTLPGATIDTTPMETNVEDVDLAFPRVSLARQGGV